MQSLLQTALWADFKHRWGWTAYQLELSDQLEIPGQSRSSAPTRRRPLFEPPARPIFVLGRALAAGKHLLYSPEVTLTESSTKVFKFLADKVKKLDSSAIFYRLELFEQLGEFDKAAHHSTIAALTKAGYRKAFNQTQPEHRQWLPINGNEATIIAGMKEKGRYNIRLAERKGVTTRISTDTSDIDVFYHLFQITAARDGFTIRVKEYFIDLCQTLFENNLGELVIAEYQGVPLVVLIVTYYDGLASYLYGASSSDNRSVMAPYAAHWAAIKAAKKRECQYYDMLQIAPPNANGRHPYTNLTRFKQQFGGQRIDLVGGWDFVYQPGWYQGFKIAEQVRRIERTRR